MRLGGVCGAVASCRSGSSCRSELVRRGCAGRNPSRAPPRRFGRALEPLRRRPPPATAFRPRPGAAPLRRRPDLALELCLRDGVSASLRCRVPRDSVSTPPWGPRPSLWRCAPALYPPHWGPRLSPGGHNPRRGHDPRSGVAPPVLGGFPAAMPRPTPPWGPRPFPWRCAPRSGDHGLCPGAALRRCALRFRDHDLCPGAVPFALELVPLRGRFGLAPALCPRSRGARCEKPSVLVAGGQNRRFFAVSEVGNGRFCRLFAYGLSGSANNRVFWS